VGVFISLIFFKMKLRRRFYISWVGLRGAVPIVFATYPLLAGIEKANMIFNIVFFISVTSVLIQGTTLSILARWLNVALPEESKKITELDQLILDLPKYSLQEFKVLPDYFIANKRIVDLHFPKSAFIVMIKRGKVYIRPGGSTEIKPNDILMVLADSKEDFIKVNECIFKPKNA
jgi:cell volume regulation protein A